MVPSQMDDEMAARFAHMPCRQMFTSLGVQAIPQKWKTNIQVKDADDVWYHQNVAIDPKHDASQLGLQLMGWNDGYRPPLLICQKKRSTVLFPIQQLHQDVTRPFIFADEDVALYFAPYDSEKSDAPPTLSS
ncbi:hypothetical protein [Nannocystis pusilla]|uniref:hypothetical protein n=1 Tax=Nannocystis pusilla TaxID=889268 RepID=UPI003B7D951F